jgi:hypothetical protein
MYTGIREQLDRIYMGILRVGLYRMENKVAMADVKWESHFLKPTLTDGLFECGYISEEATLTNALRGRMFSG